MQSVIDKSTKYNCAFSRQACFNDLTEQENILFRDDLFDETSRKLRNRNKAKIVEDISPLTAPSVETLPTYGANELSHLIFNTTERWSESIPITDTHFQSDVIGISESAFTDNQLLGELYFLFLSYTENVFSVFRLRWGRRC